MGGGETEAGAAGPGWDHENGAGEGAAGGIASAAADGEAGAVMVHQFIS